MSPRIRVFRPGLWSPCFWVADSCSAWESEDSWVVFWLFCTPESEVVASTTFLCSLSFPPSVDASPSSLALSHLITLVLALVVSSELCYPCTTVVTSISSDSSVGELLALTVCSTSISSDSSVGGLLAYISPTTCDYTRQSLVGTGLKFNFFYVFCLKQGSTQTFIPAVY